VPTPKLNQRSVPILWRTVATARDMVSGVISERDIWRAATMLTRRHGADVELEAARLADLMLDRGDIDGQWVWRRIMPAIELMQVPGAGKAKLTVTPNRPNLGGADDANCAELTWRNSRDRARAVPSWRTRGDDDALCARRGVCRRRAGGHQHLSPPLQPRPHWPQCNKSHCCQISPVHNSAQCAELHDI
jgi:hypothetical protein